MIRLSSRPGFTLLEVMIVLAIMAILAAVATLPRLTAGNTADTDGDLERAVGKAQASAIRSGRAISAVIVIHGDSMRIRAFPDGSVIAESEAPVAPMTGRVRRHE